MAVSSKKNRIITLPDNPFWKTSGLTFEQDPRPRCSLILGDGFTQSLLEFQGVRNKLRMSIADHFPPPDDVNYVPVEGDCFTESKMWDPQKWPKLYKFWESSNKPSGREFYSLLPKIKINPDQENCKLSYETTSLGFELRCYLWHLFRSHHRRLMSLGGCDLSAWEWFKPLNIFLSDFALGIATFNYDLLTELILTEVFQATIVDHDLDTEQKFLTRPIGSIALYKMHGSISYYLPGMKPLNGYNANPWLSNDKFEENSIYNVNLHIDCEMKKFPDFPDIVPPGHYGEDKFNPQSTVLPLSKCHIKSSKLIVFCGLSAEEPDTAEIRELIEEISIDSLVIQVGLQGDNKSMLAQLLSNRGIRSTFLLPSELGKLSTIINEKFSYM